MSWLLTLRFGAPRVLPLATEAASPAPPPRQAPDLAALNTGQGDARGRIRPNVKHQDAPSVLYTEDGPLLALGGWREARDRPRAVILMPADDPLVLAADLAALDRIVLEVPAVSDGRVYSSAVLIRRRLGWRGPLRLVGQVLVDQVWSFARCGVDEFALRADQDPHSALAALQAFPRAYQRSIGDQHETGLAEAAA